MNIVRAIASAIKRFGNSVTVKNGEKSARLRCFIEPLRYKNKMYLNGVMLEPGYFDGGHYLFISSDSSVFDGGYDKSVISMGDDSFIIKRLERYRAFDKVLYIWAVLTPYIGMTEDDYDSD